MVRFFVFAKAAGGVRSIVVRNATGLHNEKHTEGHKGNTAGQKKVKKHIVRLKNAVVWD